MNKVFAPSAALALLALTACAGDDDKGPAMFCPTVAVLAEGNQLTQYLPGRSDIGAELTSAQITGVAGACSLNKKKRELAVTFKAGFAATNGPANHGQPLTLPYFVAITDGSNIIQKTPYSITVSFDGNLSNATATTKTLTAIFPNIQSSANDEVLISFQLANGQAGN